MTTLALGFFLIYLLVAFLGRALLLKRSTGTAGWRGISGRPGSAAWFGGVLFAVALALGITAPVADLLGASVVFESDALRGVGLAVFLAGAAGSLVVQQAMGATWRVGVDAAEQTELVRAGPFAHVRNPFFTALVIAALGLALMVPGVLAFLGLGLLVLAVELQVRAVEEPYLLTAHGDGYRAYAESTGRFVPGVGTLGRRQP